jgi:hypothetical protein
VGLRILSVAFLMVSFILSALFARQFSWLLNGVLTYVPALFLIMSLGLVHYMTHQKDRFELLLAGEVFVVALFFRTIDEAVCSTFDLGTHFLWHLFSGLAIYIAMRALFRNLKEGRSSVGQPTGRLFKVINVALGKPGP